MLLASQNAVFKRVIASVLVLWFLLALTASLTGVLQVNQGQPPVALGLAVVVPVLLFWGFWAWSARFQGFIASLDVPTIIFLQLGRAVGLIFLVLWVLGVMPAVFAVPAGLGDVATGLAAPFIAQQTAARTGPWRRVLLIWNLFGMADLVAAVSLGILTSPSPLGLLAGAITSAPMASFPLSLIPTFLVPLYFMLHLVTLRFALGQQAGGQTDAGPHALR